MGDSSRGFDFEKVISYSNDLVNVLKTAKDAACLKHCLENSTTLRSQCDADLSDAYRSIDDYQKKIDEYKRKIEEAMSDVSADGEIDLLQKDLEEEIHIERMLREELRVLADEINELDHQRVCAEERRQRLKKLEQDEQKAQMKLSMYASVTRIIPDLDGQSKISGHIVEKDKKVVEKFELDPMKLSGIDTCNSIWKLINSP